MTAGQPTTASVDRRSGDPLVALSVWLDNAQPGDILLVSFSLPRWWLPEVDEQALTAIYSKRRGLGFVCTVTDSDDIAASELVRRGLTAWAEHRQLPLFSPGSPLQLSPLSIPKPWGREIWFTGAEERGLCQFSDGRYSLPIPWVQALLPDQAAGAADAPLVLLKILDPAAPEVTGDLYFELHQEKREVYVVTHVDKRAWPDGVGGIRYGFDPQRLAAAASEETFRQDYLDAVKAYESVRREIDRLPEEAAPDRQLQDEEQRLRKEMDNFTYMRELRVGDVVVVPLLMPHSLQHGVRTIEFQTPVYERQILSFAQKVLTQDHWDTAEAVAQMRLTPPEYDHFDVLFEKEGVMVEQIVDFPDFEVRRVSLSPGRSLELDCGDSYQLLMMVEGKALVGDAVLGPEQAALLPSGQRFFLGHGDAAEALVALVAKPHS